MPGIRIHQTAAGDRATFKGTGVGPWLSLASLFLESLGTHDETEGWRRTEGKVDSVGSLWTSLLSCE